jgi:hypothetical protein
MEKDFTPQLLIKHLYNETTEPEKTAVEAALLANAELKNEFEQLQEAKYALDEAGGESPCAMSIHNILQYSKEYHMETV